MALFYGLAGRDAKRLTASIGGQRHIRQIHRLAIGKQGAPGDITIDALLLQSAGKGNDIGIWRWSSGDRLRRNCILRRSGAFCAVPFEQGQDSIAEIFAGDRFKRQVGDAGNRAPQTAVQSIAGNLLEFADLVTRHRAIEGADHGQMLERIDDIQQIVERRFERG